MFKQIPGNHNYIISLNGEIRKPNGFHHDLRIEGRIVYIELYGKREKLDIDWLALLAHFEVNLPKNYKEIRFTEINPILTKSNSGKVMVFKKPIVLNGKYRVIPNYTNYAISKEGELLDIETEKVISINESKLFYPSVHLYDPDRSFYKNLLIHRLVALAWIPNKDYVLKPIVNHIDGNKQNYHYRNLEWCDYTENVNHAVKMGLTESVGYKVKDIETGEIKHYPSFRSFCRENGLIDKYSVKANKLKTKVKLYLDRYEVKREDDISDWTDISTVRKIKNKYTVTVKFIDGTTKVFETVRDLQSHLKIWNVSSNVNEIVKVAKTIYPGIEFDIVENFSTKPIQAMNAVTRDVIEAPTIRKMSLLTDTAFSTIQMAVNDDGKYVRNGYVFRFKSDEPWPDVLQYHPYSTRMIRAVNLKTNETCVFGSLKDTSEKLKTSFPTIKNRLETKLPLGDWEISLI